MEIGFMSGRLSQLGLKCVGLGIGFAALSFGNSPSALAINITQDSNTTSLLNNLLGDTTGLSNFSITATGDDQAFGLFSNDATLGLGSGIALSTGNVAGLEGVNDSAEFSTNLPGSDEISLDISFDADNTKDKLFFSYVFGSEEFLEFAGSSFNDFFSLSLNGVNLAFLSNGDQVNVNNLASDPAGPFSPDFISNPQGPGTTIELDGFTKVLTFEGLLNQNANNMLSINIADVGDEVLDSAVFIKGGSVGTVTPPDEAIPTPALLPGLIGFGASILRKRRNSEAAA